MDSFRAFYKSGKANKKSRTLRNAVFSNFCLRKETLNRHVLFLVAKKGSKP